ncbi:MAG: molybdopterin-guanine dinucleotide biosynthesis protein MobB [Candidatus Bathyarchaeia archaeon]
MVISQLNLKTSKRKSKNPPFKPSVNSFRPIMVLRICIVGFKSTGKTRLIASIVKTFSSRGLRVVVVKHSHERVDLKVKSTARILNSKPVAVAYQSPYDNVLVFNSSFNLEALLDILNPHVVLYEGFKSSPYPKILTALKQEHLNIDLDKSLVKMVVGPEDIKEAASKLYSNARFSNVEDENLMNEVLRFIVEEYASMLPKLDCGRCGYDTCSDYAEKLIENRAKLGKCVIVNPPAKLYVDWSKVDLSLYPATVLNSLLSAFVGTLKGVKKDPVLIVASAFQQSQYD